MTTDRRMPPLYLLVNGNVGPFHPDLLDAWIAEGIGGACLRCGLASLLGWDYGLPQCGICLRAYLEALGCRCGGSLVCEACRAAGATAETRVPKCRPGCSTLCAVCCEDD